jgi:phage tail tape-measure protein
MADEVKDNDYLDKGKKLASDNPTLTGAAAGAVIGSVVPGIGTLAGALVGGFLGHLHGQDKK